MVAPAFNLTSLVDPKSRFRVATKSRAVAAVYSLRMKRWRTLLDRLLGGRRPPTGPLTTQEAADAEESRQKRLASDAEASRHEQSDAGVREP